jgi:predicted O-methyltransferase YrrM
VGVYIKRVLKPLVLSLTRTGDLDLKSVTRRLDQIWGCNRDSLGIYSAVVSGVMSAEASPEKPDDYLFELASQLLSLCRHISLPLLKERRAPELVNLWPGEHYRLLAALVRILRPRSIVEFGTFSGLSTLAMVPEMVEDSRIVTFDVVPWNRVENTYLCESDFRSGAVVQEIANVADATEFAKHQRLICTADLLFVDGPKDGIFEPRLFEHFQDVPLKPGTLVVLDDMHFFNLLSVWRGIARPKLDITGFGHWSGTGLIHWV